MQISRRFVLLLLLLLLNVPVRAQQPTDNVIAEWAQEILLGSEFGGDGRICSRWTKSPTLAVIGGTPEQYKLVTEVVADINSVLAKTPIPGIRVQRRGETRGDMRVYFARMSEFDGIARKENFRYTQGNRGYFYNRWNGKHEIYDGVILLATDKLSGGQLRHYTLEEITQALGLQNDSAAFADSIFYSGPKGNGNAEKLSDRDRQLLNFFYSHVSPGHDQRRLRSAIKRHWLKNVTFVSDSKDSTWAQTILLGSEYGGDGKLCNRWTKSPRLSVFGGTQQHREVIADTVAHINETLSSTPIKRIELMKPNADNADIRVYFAPLSEFNNLARKHRFSYPPGNLGYFYTRWNGRNEMYSATIMLATDRLTGSKLRHYALEEITQSLGLASDSPAYSDSIFFEKGSNYGNAVRLSSRDKKLVSIFYNHIKPGARRTEVREAVRKYWDAPVETKQEAVDRASLKMIWLGATLKDLKAEEFPTYGVSKEAGGVAVTDVAKASPTAEAGLRNGDLIQGLSRHGLPADDEHVHNLDQFFRADVVFASGSRETSGVGSRYRLKVIRARKPIELSVAPAYAVVIEAATNPDAFRELTRPPASKNKIVANQETKNASPASLTDGKIDSGYGPVFSNSVYNGAYKMDLGSVKPISAVTSWSFNQGGTRGAQRLTIYGSNATKDPGWDLKKFQPMGTVHTGKQESPFLAASLRATNGNTLGTFRWVVWRVSPVSKVGGGENTAFQELAVSIAH